MNDIDGALANAKTIGMDIVARKAQTDLFYLEKYILGGGDLINKKTHGEMCDYTKPLLPNYNASEHELPENFDDKKTNVLLLMPRGTLKSTVVTIGFSIQTLLNDPDARILIDSETYSKSVAFLSELKGHLEGNKKLRDIFHHIYGCYPDDNKKNDLWSDKQLNIAARTRKRKEPSISCAGVDVTKNGMHYDLIIMDDLHSEKNTANKEQIENVVDHYKLSWSLLDPGKPMIVIGTRWDYTDLYQHLIDNESKRFNILIKRAIQEDGSLLFPGRLTREFLDMARESQGSYIFSCQYLNEPVDNETATFKREYFHSKPWNLVKDIPINWFFAVDPSYGGPYSDYAAFVLAGLDAEGNLYVRNIHRAKMTYADIINILFDWYQKYQPRRIALETVGTQKNIQYMLNAEQKRRGIWLPVKEITHRSRSKEERVRSLAPYYEFHRVIHIAESAQIAELEYELIHFPKGKHDDIVDALATILDIATPPSRKKTSNKYKARKKRNRVLLKPRSPITGV